MQPGGANARRHHGAEPGGGGYIAQRMLAARNEKEAMGATMWFNIAHYALRPWPWIIVALCSILVFPSLADIQTALPHVSDDLIGNDLAYPAMLTLLPAGLLGLLVASLLAAYVSTMSTHLNWGCSYLVHDLYRRFLDPGASERHLVWLETIAGVAPLLGLLGTVVGMIKVFSAITTAGVGNPAVLAGGISEALITTAAGLTVAIPSLMFHRYFTGSVRRLASKMEEEATKMVEVMQGERERDTG